MARYSFLLIIFLHNLCYGSGIHCGPCICKQDVLLTAYCSNRKLSDVPPMIPESIDVLLLNNNRISHLRNYSISRFPNLTVLDVSFNNISFIDRNVQRLRILNIGHCFNSYSDDVLSSALFKPLQNLQTLILNRRRENYKTKDTYPVSGLQVLKSLESLTLDGLTNVIFDERFQNLSSLKELSLSGHVGMCNIQHLQQNTFLYLKFVENLNISKCKLVYVHPETFQPLQNIHVLDLSQNPCLHIAGIENATHGLRNSSTIRKLFVNEVVDKLSSCVNMGVTFFENLQNTYLSELHADNNRIETFAETAFGKLPKSLSKISVRDNRFTYGRYLSRLQDLHGLQEIDISGSKYSEIVHMNEIANCSQIRCVCVSSSTTRMDRYSYQWTTEEQVLVIPVPKMLRYINLRYRFYSSFIKSITFAENSLRKIDLSYNVLTSWIGPVCGLENLTYLDLSNNNARNVSTTFFKNFPSLTVLNISSNILTYIFDNSTAYNIFNGLPNLQTLDLSFNVIYKLQPDVFEALTSLQVLNLSNNFLLEFNSSVTHLTNLRLIDCRKNNIRWIRLPIRNQLDQLANEAHGNITVNLAGNIFDCTCENLKFLQWLRDSEVQFEDRSHYECMYSNGDVISLSNLDDILVGLQEQCHNKLGLFIGIGLLALFMFILIIYSLAFRYRWKLRYWYYAARLRFGENNFDSADFEYDVFVSFADEDREFVVTELLVKLEVDAGLRLNIHQRDFTPGRPIATNIIEAVKNSRKTLLILSEHFIKSYWCIYELQMANMESVSTGRDVILILRIGNIPPKGIPTEILYHFKTDSFIEYPQTTDKSLFWLTLTSSLKL